MVMSSKSDKFVNILLLNYEYPPIGGGASNATYYILKEFSKIRNIKIDVITSSVSSFEIINFSSNIKIHRLDIGKNGNLHYQSNKELLLFSWKAYWYVKNKLKINEYDLIHAFFGIPCGYIAMKLNKPYIVSLRGSDVPLYNERFKYLDKLVFKRLSKKIWKKAYSVVANSKGLKDLALLSSPEQDISVIYNGVDVDKFVPDKNKNRNKKITLISTGRLIPRKGYKYLLEALKDFSGFRLILLGGGVQREELEECAKENNIDLKCFGKVDHSVLIDKLNEADIFILPSLNEGMSNSVLEAMSCGLPVIVTDVGGSEELINDNGFIVKKGSSEEIKKVLTIYQNNPKLILEHGIKSREIARNMSWKKMAGSYLEIYKEII